MSLLSTVDQWGITTKLLFLLLSFLLSIPFLFLPLLTLTLALITTLRYHLTSSSSSSKKSWSEYNSSIYIGRVSHTRYKPVTHSFSYPLFFMFLDLNEIDSLFQKKKEKRAVLWPLNYIMQFRDVDHLKNGEGLSSSDNNKDSNDNSLTRRVQRLISEKTRGTYVPKSTQRIMLLTHLSYFGYCFNPVSFYYVLKEEEKDNKSKNGEENNETEIEAIVAEVSNTPWEEMSCYVLHPDSMDVTTVKPGRVKKEDIEKEWKSVNYIFNKQFHVSPFMEMDHIYDWTFWDTNKNKIAVSTTMIKQSTNETYFNAYFEIFQKSQSTTIQPLVLAKQLIKYPLYCIIIQIWIHVEAFWLFLKGVPFIPHPEGSETTASKIIANLMAPFFVVKEWMEGGSSSDSSSEEKESQDDEHEKRKED